MKELWFVISILIGVYRVRVEECMWLFDKFWVVDYNMFWIGFKMI